MTTPMWKRPVVATLAVAAIALLALTSGCSEDGPLGPGSGDTYVKASTPINSARRLCATYSAKDIVFYTGHLTADFRYTFSAAADPDLVSLYGDTWGLDDEAASALHLFLGFVDDSLNAQLPAKTIAADFVSASVLDDADHPDSTSHYRRVRISPLGVEITLTDDSVIDIANVFDVYVVRGDAAVRTPAQARDSTVWYVRRIADLAEPLASRALKPAQAATWGQVRAFYRS